MQKDIIFDSLIELGISSISAKIYLSLLADRTAGVTLLSKKYHIQRWKVYECLDELLKHGLIKELTKYARTITINPPTLVLSKLNQKEFYLKEKISGLSELIPSLLGEYYNSKTDFIEVYKGKTSLQNLFDLILDETDDTIYGLGNFESWLELLGVEYEKSWRRRRIERKIRFKALAYPGYLVNEANPKNFEELRDMKLLPHSLKTDGILLISKDKVTQWNPILPRAISIKDPIFNKFFTNIFELIWGLV